MKYLVFILLLITWRVDAATINAASGSSTDVQAAVDSANHAGGDTVVIPDGTNVYHTNVWITFPLTVTGNSTNTCAFIDEVPRTLNPSALFNISSTNATGLFSLGNFTIWGGTSNTQNNFENGLVRVGTSNKTVRIHNINFVTNWSDCIGWNDALGVIDHCSFVSVPYGRQAMKIHHRNWNGVTYGDGSWAADTMLGTSNFCFIEDCYFKDQNFASAIDWEWGGRVVIRYNIMTNTFVGNHGLDTTGRNRSARCWEIYFNDIQWNNIAVANSPWPFAIYFRGGTGVVWSNTIVGVDADTLKFPILSATYRATTNPEGYPWSPWGPCWNTIPGVTPQNVWDQNNATNGWACMDQVGRGKGDLISGDTPINTVFGSAHWPRQALEPMYQWGNKRNGVAVTASSQSSTIQVNRDWYDNVTAPGYTPFVYPHPLVSGSPAPPVPPSSVMKVTTFKVNNAHIGP